MATGGTVIFPTSPIPRNGATFIGCVILHSSVVPCLDAGRSERKYGFPNLHGGGECGLDESGVGGYEDVGVSEYNIAVETLSPPVGVFGICAHIAIFYRSPDASSSSSLRVPDVAA